MNNKFKYKLVLRAVIAFEYVIESPCGDIDKIEDRINDIKWDIINKIEVKDNNMDLDVMDVDLVELERLHD